jgi:hypothetical protein
MRNDLIVVTVYALALVAICFWVFRDADQRRTERLGPVVVGR